MKKSHVAHLVDNLTIPDSNISIQLVEKETVPQLAELAHKNKDFLLPWLSWVKPDSTLKSFSRLLEDQVNRLNSGENIKSILFILKQEGEYIGMLNIQPKLERSSVIEFGFWVDKGAQGKGITSKVISVVSDVLCKNIKNIILRIRTFTDNQAAIHVAKNSGFIEKTSDSNNILIFERM